MSIQLPAILSMRQNILLACRLILICFSAPLAEAETFSPPPVEQAGKQVSTRESSQARALAEKVSRLLDDMLAYSNRKDKGHPQEEKVVRLNEKEVNAYIQHQILTQGRPGLQSVQMRFIGANQIGVSAIVDFDSLPVENSGIAMKAVKSLLSGKREVYIEGTLFSQAGTAQFSLDKAFIGGLRIPALVLSQIHDLMARLNAGRPLSEPRPLPYGLRSMEITKEALILRC